MEEKVKEKSKFIDNVAYKSKFQFLIWVNDNVICQRYFKVNGYYEDFLHSAEFDECMYGIVESIKRDLESKSRIFMWYYNTSEPLKMTGFMTDEEVDKYGEDFVSLLSDTKIVGDIIAPDGKVFKKTYLKQDNFSDDPNDNDRPENDEFIFKFSFLIDDVPVFEKIWDGNVYPKFVRNGVDLTNAYSNYNNDTSMMNFGSAIIRYMQKGKTNLINDFIHRICDTLSLGYYEDEKTHRCTKEMGFYGQDNNIDRHKYEEAVKLYGVIKPVVTGHTDLDDKDYREYDYYTPYEKSCQYWAKKCRKKTQQYFNNITYNR